MTNATATRPWLSLYGADLESSLRREFVDAVSMFQAAAEKSPAGAAIQYFDGQLTYRQLDEFSSRLAKWCDRSEVRPGDRIAIVLQNVPQFVIALVAAWKIGAIAAPINPMNRERELTVLFADCLPKIIICDGAAVPLVSTVVRRNPGLDKTIIVRTNPSEFQTRNDRRVLTEDGYKGDESVPDLMTVIHSESADGFRAHKALTDDVAVLLYTSGTTGLPKGAMLSHSNLCFSAQVFRDWIGLGRNSPVLGIAPLFHVTGIVGHIAVAILTASPLILCYRFEPNVVLDAVAEHHPQFAVGAITAFLSLLNLPQATAARFATFKAIYSGGAPVPPAVVENFEFKTGHYIHNSFGMTETTSPVVLVPRGARAPVDPVTGALSIGVPVFDTDVRIVDVSGALLPPRELGEIIVRGPQIMRGYWNKPSETTESIIDGWMHTEDIGFMDEQGWVYIVDRKKDMINAAGYKVWPREIEDVIYSHPAIREAAVVGVQDAYRGETVKAVVSVKLGHSLSPAELTEFCKERMAAYKYPRIVEIIDELPKTVSGKILRRELREGR
jgi:long-chain acyl-CoA synthetase